MKVCFFGVGGVGGYFGSLITEKFKEIHEIFFVARGAHNDAICANGLTLRKAGGNEVINVVPAMCTDNTENLPICDIVILSVKSYDLTNASKQIEKIMDKNTIVLPLLNGVDIYNRIRDNLHIGTVLQSCVYVGTHIERPGVIYQNGGNCKILIGCDPGYPELYPDMLLTLLKNSNVDFSWEGKAITSAIWSKYIFIAAYGMITAAYGKTIGQVMESSELSKMTRAIMSEIVQIANRLKINLSPDIVDVSFFKASQFPYDTKTSFQRDFELKGKLNEGDLFGGTLIRYGNELRVPIPNIEFVCSKLIRNCN